MWTYETHEPVLTRREIFALEFGKTLLYRDGLPSWKGGFTDHLISLVDEVVERLDATDPDNEDEE